MQVPVPAGTRRWSPPSPAERRRQRLVFLVCAVLIIIGLSMTAWLWWRKEPPRRPSGNREVPSRVRELVAAWRQKVERASKAKKDGDFFIAHQAQDVADRLHEEAMRETRAALEIEPENEGIRQLLEELERMNEPHPDEL